ncbi:hypothetical protein [Flavobacterium notoginsengisoli]|uniref:hypothetical protein n=1 Tax=Flavobacterium notoginsengisoli TaxID=1478199 RepID=UPI003633C488
MEPIKEIIRSLNFGTDNPNMFNVEQVMNSFKQGRVKLPLLKKIGGGGNCASVAIIKAAIGTFGFENVFKSIVIDDINQRFLVDLRDRKKTVYSLSFKNYKRAAEMCDFEQFGTDGSSKNILEFAKFCFAVMAEIKRNEYRINRSYRRAVDDLNKGESTYYIHEYLGLNANDIKDISIENLSTIKNLILWNPPHAVYSSEGFYDEAWSEVNGKKIDPIQPLSMLAKIHGDGTLKYNPIGAQTLS